ncbi:unnamed protein product [Schistosoma curassoni]|nr:unnamed protein product [Schistosoma curassoni]
MFLNLTHFDLRDQELSLALISKMCLNTRYIDLVNHYNALSYDSPVFANLVFWRCQQLCHVKYRCALWGEHQQVLNSPRIVLNQLYLSSFSLLILLNQPMKIKEKYV